MSHLQNTREYRALKESFNNNPAFEPWLKACLEYIEETLRDPEEPNWTLMCSTRF
jgi:hypothetical protein